MRLHPTGCNPFRAGVPSCLTRFEGRQPEDQFKFRALTPSRKRSVPFAAPAKSITQDHAWGLSVLPRNREFMRNAVLNLTLIIPATAYHQRNYVERYSSTRRLTEYPCHRISHDGTHKERATVARSQ